MEQTKTLIILSPGFAKDEQDTTCLPAHQVFVRALNKNFPSVKIIILAFQYPFFLKEYKWFENEVISFNGNRQKGLLKIILWWRTYKTLKRLSKQNNIVGLLSFWCTEYALIGKYFAKKNKIRQLIWITGQDAKEGNKYVRRIRPNSNELVAMSDFLSDTFLKNYGVKPFNVIPNGIDVSVFDKSVVAKTIDIMGAGSLIPLKQYDVFIEVVAEIRKLFSSIKVVLVGAGIEEKKLKELIHQYHLEDNIHLSGNIGHRKVLELMQQSKIFLHPSSYEGFSTVCLEALYAGTHVISFIQPMHQPIQNWHIVKTKEEMIETALRLFKVDEIKYEPVLPFPIDENAKAMMRLFNYSE